MNATIKLTLYFSKFLLIAKTSMVNILPTENWNNFLFSMFDIASLRAYF